MRFRTFYSDSKKKSILECFKLLSEASIYNDSYPIGSMVKFKEPALKIFNNKIEKPIDNSPLEKTSPIKKGTISVQYGTGKEEVYLKHTKSGQIFHIFGNSSSISSQFNHFRTTTGINWKDTPTLETAQVLGFFVDGITMLSDISDPKIAPKKIKTWTKSIKSAFGNGQDWHKKGSSQIGAALETMSLGDWAQLALLVAGSTNFKNKIVEFGTINIIHGSINDYYNTEEKNPKIKTAGSKENTADMIVSNTPIDPFLKVFETSKVVYNTKGLCTIGKSIKFYQVSLKKSMGGAQLGKILGLLQKKYGIPSYNDLLSTILDESNTLDEGILDIIKTTGNMLKQMGKAVFERLVSLVSKITSFGSGIVGNMNRVVPDQLKKDVNSLEKQMGVEKGYLSDCIEINSEGLIVEKAGLNERLRGLKTKQVNVILDNVNLRLKQFEKSTKANKYFFYKSTTPLKQIKKTDFISVLKLFANYTAIFIFNNVASKKAGKADLMFKEISEIQKEMFFGKTLLPIYKVFGAKKLGDTNTYKFLGSGEFFQNKKVNEIKKQKNVAMAFRSNIDKSKNYYIFISHMIMGMNEEGEYEYSEIRIGTNRGDAGFSFSIEGAFLLPYRRMAGKYNIK